jgi:hypothetical protein
MSLQAFLALKVSVEKSAVTLMGLPFMLFVFSLQYSFAILCAGVLEASCTGMGISFLGVGKFSAIILLNTLHIHLARTSSTLMLMIHWCGL